MLLALGATLGALLGIAGGWLADVLPGRYAITHLVSASARRKRYVALVVLSVVIALGIARILAGISDESWHVYFLLAVNAGVATALLAGAAIDLEHMILPNEITIGTTVVCLLSSPLRSVGIVWAIAGAMTGFLTAYLPSLLFKKLRGRSGMGFGDAMLAISAGAWHGVEGAIYVLFAGAVQLVLTGAVMRLFGWVYTVPTSVNVEITTLRASAKAGDKEARAILDDDPMAADEEAGAMGMRLPLGPFLVLACIEALFLRRWLVDTVFAWFLR